MADVIWMPFALQQLEDILNYIAEDSPAAARRIVTRIRASAGQLREFPYSGRIVPERPRLPYREIIEPPYRIIYRVDELADIVHIIAVVHSRRRLPRLPR